eukprot:gnl/Chilomastix_cuspidata/3555.p1 GENE.gnl/Chilomastix_cuspidata/3555~~gnl/Chilomastix_cuspidata/3555.p1  ORF type:complete len:460 (-),score=97.90 gnl/Chilomastix_cuspidata/3555:159-1538(-)
MFKRELAQSQLSDFKEMAETKKKEVHLLQEVEEFKLSKQNELLKSFPSREAITENCRISEKLFADCVSELITITCSARCFCTQNVGLSFDSTFHLPSTAAEESACADAASKLRAQIALTTRNISHYHSAIEKLEHILTLSEFPEDVAAQRMVIEAIAEFCGTAGSVNQFLAFPFVEQLEAVQAVTTGPLMPFGPISVSQPFAAWGLPPAPRTDVLVSLSRDGILCASDGMSRSLTVYDFFSGRSVTLAGGSNMFGVVFRDELFVCWRLQRCMRHAPIAAVLAGRPITAFAQFELVDVYDFAPCLDTAPKGHVSFLAGGSGERVVYVDLEHHTSHILHLAWWARAVSGFTGVCAPDAVCVVSAGADERAHILFESGRTEPVARRPGQFAHILPSARDCTDITHAALLDCEAGISYDGQTVPFASPFTPAAYTSIVRLYKNVFLYFDNYSSAWYAVRINVP